MGNLRFEWATLAIVLFKLAVAMILTLPIGLERERSTRIMGLRTFPIVAIASCAYVLVAGGLETPMPDVRARTVQGLMTGIGFIGGGAILHEGLTVRGTATAASVWTTGALGAAVALDQYEIALLLSILTYLTLRMMAPWQDSVRRGARGDHQEEGP